MISIKRINQTGKRAQKAMPKSLSQKHEDVLSWPKLVLPKTQSKYLGFFPFQHQIISKMVSSKTIQMSCMLAQGGAGRQIIGENH